MSRPALIRTAVLSILAAFAGCAKEAPPPPPQAAYVPPPLPDPAPAPWCARPAEISAFSVAALKSNLMVATIQCNKDDRYNAFITRYRQSLIALEKARDEYFSRNDKRHWQQDRDDYITQLANAQSQRAMVLGDQFCQRTVSEFDEVLALPGPEQLPGYAESKSQSIPQTMKFSECPSPPPVAQKPARSKNKT
jgi:hypothetical protein